MIAQLDEITENIITASESAMNTYIVDELDTYYHKGIIEATNAIRRNFGLNEIVVNVPDDM